MDEHTHERTVRILAIDGGGIRGIIPAVFVAEIEQRCRKPAWQLFDVIAGTSTGSLVTAMLTLPGGDKSREPYSGREVVDYYAGEKANHFFSRSLAYRLVSANGWLRPKYTATTHAGALREALGDTAEIRDARTEVVITMYDLRAQPKPSRTGFRGRTWVFTRNFARGNPDHNYKTWEVVRAASTAPAYYPGWTMRSLNGRTTHYPVDGGVYANNPVVDGLAHAIYMQEKVEEVIDGRVGFVVLSLGTGFHDEPIHLGRERKWGLLGWARPIIDVMYEGQSDAADAQMLAMLPSTKSFRHYVRLQPRIPKRTLLDDTDPGVRQMLEQEARRTIKECSGDIDAVCRELGA